MAKIKKFGTFGGVFTPSILTILGVIMYMRLPMIAGEAGLFGTLGIILVAHLISITTGLSVSSIATDKKVKEGGTYYIISRSLGLPIGGTLGLALFVGLSFSVSLYLIGFSESFLGYFNLPMDIYHIRVAGSIILLLVTIITLISTSLAIKAQYLIMTAIVLSLLSILLGNHDMAPVTPNFFGKGTGISLMVLFGIFFPAVTGFEAGVSMSGDLKDAKKSIPLGTISAISIGLFVYIGLAFFFAYTVDGQLLATDPNALFKIALVPQLVIAGIWGATLSSALGSILAAPRILQSTALDKITPRFFALGSGASKEPRNALLLTFIIAEAGILIGDLDIIARIVSIFFITTYGFLNLSAAFESITSADFRPTFKIPAWVSIIGALACILVMIQLDFLAMIGAIIILGSLFLLLTRRQLVLETGDAWSSVWSTLVRTGLNKLNKLSQHSRNWRPNIILFCGQDHARPYLVELARAFSGRLGMFSAFEMVETTEQRLNKDQRFNSASRDDELIIHQHKCRNIYDGMDEIARIYGFSGVEPNTILMGWSKNENNKDKFLKLLRNFEESDFNSILLNYDPIKKLGEKKTIDVWWSGWGSNLTFSIFLLRHFTSAGDWKDAHIRLLIINNVQARTETVYKQLEQILAQYRISLEIKIINNSIDGLPKHEIISRESAGTDLTFIGIPDRQYQHIDHTYEDALILTHSIGTFVMVNSSSAFESFDLGLEMKDESAMDNTKARELELPELQPSKYQVINEDIRKIDINGQKVLSLFFEKAFGPVFSEINTLTTELQSALSAIFIQLDKMESLDDEYRRRKTLIKIKNDFYFRANKILTELATKKLNTQKEALESGIKWYSRQLDEDLLKFPLKLEIPYEKQDLALKKKDPFRLKLSKLRRRMAHPFSKNNIPGKIRYHEIAAYYLRNNRHYFLSAFLERFQKDLFAQLSEGRALIIAVDTMLEGLMAKAMKKEELIRAIETEQQAGEEKIENIISAFQNMQEQFRNRFLLEFRKNLQLMANDMGKADINFRIRRKRRNKNYYEDLVKKNSQFTESWYELTLNQVNKIHMDVILQSFKSRIKDKINDLNLKITQQLDKGYRTDLEQVRKKLEKLEDHQDQLSGFKFNIHSYEDSISILKDFDLFSEDILKLTETLPESMTIASNTMAQSASGETAEALEVPLRKITRFYIESRFLGTAHDNLEKNSESLKNSIFMVQDLLNLTRFNLENIPDDQADRNLTVSSIIKDVNQKIMKEEEKILQVKVKIIEMIDTLLQEVFDQLSSYKIPQTVSEYSRFIRELQGKIVIRTFDNFMDRLRTFFKRFSARVLYSRSEGILLAKKIMETEPQNTINQKILDLVEFVSPKEKVIIMLPQFYKNLFSGRSSISEDFWIKREKDEEMFRTAVRRNQSIYHGGILITGERNSGKTAFCKNVCTKLFKKDKIHHIFPPLKGSSRREDFIDEIRKLGNVNGVLDEIMGSFPQGSVFVVHDLELWWERSPQGWDVVNLLTDLINRYSGKFLFVVNMNPYAFKLMNKIMNLQNVFIGIIPLRPMDSMEIQEMIIRRHRSSGLKFMLRKTEEDELSEIRQASLFNKYFDYSEGNPGTALKAWLANIVKVSADTIYMRPPRNPETGILGDMDEDWKVVLIQMVLHKRLTYDRIAKIFPMDDEKTSGIISSMLRAGLIEKRKEDLFVINNFIEPHLINSLKRESLL